jgi:hypothetical protein
MKSAGGRFVFACVLAVGSAAVPASAGIIIVGAQSDPVVVGAEVRNGVTAAGAGSFKGEIFTGSSASPNSLLYGTGGPSFNWQYGHSYNFDVNYSAATGLLKLTVDFTPAGGSPSDPQNIPVTFTSLAGHGFQFIDIAATGNNQSNVTISNLSINGDVQSNITSNQGTVSTFFADQTPNTILNNIDVTGRFVFSASGGTEDIPRFDINFIKGGSGGGGGDPPPSQGAPEPCGMVMFASLAAIGGLFVVARRRR